MAQLTFFICGLKFLSYFNLRRVAMHDQNTQMLLFQALDASLIHETSMCTYYLLTLEYSLLNSFFIKPFVCFAFVVHNEVVL